LKIEGYQCRICQSKEFMGKSGRWVCSQCSVPVPLSLLTYMEFEHNRPVIRVSPRTAMVQRNR
jgi:ribosomal protein L37AE/L43A